jgi:hypothetical protein
MTTNYIDEEKEKLLLELFLKNPKRTHSFFLATIEKPRTINEIAEIWKVSNSTWYVDELNKKMLEAGLVVIVGFKGERPLYYARMEGFLNFLLIAHRKTGQLELPSIALDVLDSVIASVEEIRAFFETKTFRNFWNEDTLKSIPYHLFSDYTFLLNLFLCFLTFSFLVLEFLEMGLEFEKAKNSALGTFLIFDASSKEIFPKAQNILSMKIFFYLKKDMVKDMEILKKSSVWKKISSLFLANKDELEKRKIYIESLSAFQDILNKRDKLLK